jgi:exopolysaccharide biosynthesis polyprenyl glycosylphosphotransferase
MSRPPLNSPGAGTRPGSLGEVQSLDQPLADLPTSSPLLRARTDAIASPPVKAPSSPRSTLSIVDLPEAVEPSSAKNRSERLDLARDAPQVMRRHLAQAVVRISVLLTGDACALLMLRFIMQGIRDQAWLGPTVASIAARMIPMGAVPLVQLLPAVFLGLIILDNYGANDRRRDTGRLVAGSALGLALPFWGYIWSRFSPLAIPGFFLLAAATALALIWERQLIDKVVRRLRPIGPGALRVLLIGRPQEALAGFDHPALSDRREFAMTGVFDPDEIVRHGVAGAAANLCQKIKQCKADTLLLCGRLDDAALSVILDATAAAGCHVLALTRAFSVAGVEPQLIWRRGAPLVALTRPGLRARQLLLKRALDVVGAGLGLILLAPVFAALALAVKASSRGPVFFRQQRVGRGGASFMIMKFRSMVEDAESRRDALEERSIYADARLFKIKQDPRVTRLGSFLRRSSLDELPQLLNVLKGEMSLVGPRPPLPSEVDLYEEHHYTRFDMKPGITGPWQVSGRNSITDFEEVIRLETAYIREWGVWKDFAILMKTIPAVLSMRGAL